MLLRTEVEWLYLDVPAIVPERGDLHVAALERVLGFEFTTKNFIFQVNAKKQTNKQALIIIVISFLLNCPKYIYINIWQALTHKSMCAGLPDERLLNYERLEFLGGKPRFIPAICFVLFCFVLFCFVLFCFVFFL